MNQRSTMKKLRVVKGTKKRTSGVPLQRVVLLVEVKEEVEREQLALRHDLEHREGVQKDRWQRDLHGTGESRAANSWTRKLFPDEALFKKTLPRKVETAVTAYWKEEKQGAQLYKRVNSPKRAQRTRTPNEREGTSLGQFFRNKRTPVRMIELKNTLEGRGKGRGE